MNELRWILLGIGLVLLALIYLFSRRSSEDDNSLPPADHRFEPPLSRDDGDIQHEQFDAESSFDDNNEIHVSASGRFAVDADTPASGRFAVDADTPASGRSAVDADTPVPASVPGSAVSGAPALGDEPVATDAYDQVEEPAPEPPLESTSTPVVPEKVIALHLMPMSGEMFEGLEFVGAIQAEGLKFGRFDIFHRFTDPENTSDESPTLFSVANMIKPGTFNLHDLDSQQFKGASLFLVLPGPDDAVAAFADMLATGRRLAVTLNGQLLDSQGTKLSRQSASHLREDIINYQHGLSATPAE